MNRSIPLAKISVPRLFGVVARTRLFARLDDNRGRPLIWLDSPPGAGKTSLVASYLAARAIPTLWYQVDSGDADPGSLFMYLSGAAGKTGAHIDSPLPRFLPEHLSDPAAFSRTYFRRLFERLPEGSVLVLDNYQEAPTECALHQIIRSAIDEVPPGNSIVCISRTEAPSVFAELAVRGAMHTLRWEALQLTLDETRELTSGRNIADDWLVKALHQQSGGWAAGVTLMMERLGQATATPGELPRESTESVFNYFAALLFDQLPEVHQRLLSTVAFLPYMTPSMASQVGGSQDAESLLEHLHRRRLFVDRRPGAHTSYVFHALFRDFLKLRANTRVGVERVAELMLRCADALDAVQDREAAIDLRIEAASWQSAVSAISKIADDMLRDGRRHTLERWIGALPRHIVEADPWITFWLGMSRGQRAPEAAVAILCEALVQFQHTQDTLGRLRTLVALLKLGYMGQFTLSVQEQWVDELIDIVSDPHLAPLPVQLELSVWGALCWPLLSARPWHPWTGQAHSRLLDLLRDQPPSSSALAAATTAMDCAAEFGHFDVAERLLRWIEPVLSDPGVNAAEAAWALTRMGYLRFHQARYEDSLKSFDLACTLARSNGLQAVLSFALMSRYMVEFRISGWNVALATLKEVESMPALSYPIWGVQMSIYQARRAEFLGEHARAADLARASHRAAVKTESLFLRGIYGVICAELLIRANRIVEANELLDHSRALCARAIALQHWSAALELVQSYLHLADGDETAARSHLRIALESAKSDNRHARLRFLETSMPPMFAFALKNGIEVEFVQHLIRTYRLDPPARAPDNWPWPIRIHTLGRFEIVLDGKALEFSRKIPKKTLALLKALIAHGGEEIPESWLCDALWGDEEADAAREALGITILRLRKLLGSNTAITQQGGRVTLDRTRVWVDVWQFESHAQRQDPDAAHDALHLYLGIFLPQDEGETWSVATRERLRGKFIHLLATHGAALEQAGDLEQAVALYFRGIDADTIVETFHQGLMRCYQRQGRHTEAISAYRRLRQTMSAVLGVTPAESSRQLYESSMRACGETIEQQARVVKLPGIRRT